MSFVCSAYKFLSLLEQFALVNSEGVLVAISSDTKIDFGTYSSQSSSMFLISQLEVLNIFN